MKPPVQGPRALTFWPLVATTYFMVAGGPYGLEDLLASTGLDLAIVILIVTPIVWSLPTALMVGELASAMPEEGGYYAWVRRALGPFWGFMEGWLSLLASVFDMAIYPTLFGLYLARVWPQLGGPWASSLLGVGLIAASAAWNVRGARAVGGAALMMTVALLAPFAVLVAFAMAGQAAHVTRAGAPSSGSLVAGLLVAMWNFMGWDNASTMAGEVHRPQRTYPLAMLVSVVLVTATYLLPVLALRRAGLDTAGFSTGSWVEAARAIGGHPLGLAVMLGGAVCAFGVFNVLVLSYSRLPVALAQDGYLPAVFTRRHGRTRAPWVAIVACAMAWALALRLGFQRLVELDVLLYGLGLVLQFVALVTLRVREPELVRPFRIPGGLLGAIAVGVAPTSLIVLALAKAHREQARPIGALSLGLLLVLGGPLVYTLGRTARARALARRMAAAVDGRRRAA